MEEQQALASAERTKRKVYGEACRSWRASKGISQESMALQLGLRDAKTYSRYENGESAWSLDLLENIAKVVGAGSVPALLQQPYSVHVAHSNQTNSFSENNNYHEASAKEREQLLERINHLQEEVLFLRRQLEAALGTKRS